MHHTSAKLVLIVALVLSSWQVTKGNFSSKDNEKTTTAASWGSLRVSPEAIGYVKYRNYRISVYESLDTQRRSQTSGNKQFFCTPILLLEPRSAKAEHLILTDQHVVSFDVVIWNDDIESRVLKYMSHALNIDLERAQVKPLPFEELVLTCATAKCSCYCPPEWHSYQLHDVITFKLVCPSQQVAWTVANTLKRDPQQFESTFKMKFSLDTRKTGRRETTITVENVVSGDMFSKLEQRFPGANEILLTADDAKKLISESASNVLVDTLEENEVSGERSEAFIQGILKTLMLSGTTRVEHESKSMWDSVFWNVDAYRPDKIASELTEVHRKSDVENQKRLVDAVANSDKAAIEHSFLETLAKSLEAASSLRFDSDKSDAGGSGNVVKSRRSSEEDDSHHSEDKTKDAGSAELSLNIFGILDTSGKGSGGVERQNNLTNTSNTKTEENNELNIQNHWDMKNVESNRNSSASGSTDSVTLAKKTQLGKEISSMKDSQSDDKIRALGESLTKVDWTGAKFIAKPMTLTRINMANIRNRQSYKDMKLSVAFSTSVLSLPVNINVKKEMFAIDSEQIYATKEEFHRKLKSMNDSMSTLIARENAELRNDLSRLAVLLNDSLDSIASNMSKTKEKMEALINGVKNDFQAKDESIEKVISDMNTASLQMKSRLESQISVLESSFHKLNRSIGDLKSQSSMTNVKLEQQINMTSTNLTKNVIHLESAIAEVKKDSSSSIAQLNSAVAHGRFTSIQNTREMLDSFGMEVDKGMKDHVDSLRKSLTPKDKIMFNARKCNEGFNGSEKIVSYTELLFNVGDGMNNHTGVFTAPRNGYYAFLFHGTKVSWDAAFSIMTDGSQVVSEWTGTDRSNLVIGITLSAVTYLKQGSIAYVKMRFGHLLGYARGGKLRYNRYDSVDEIDLRCLITFSGFSLD